MTRKEEIADRLRRLVLSAERFGKLLSLSAPQVLLTNEIELMQRHAYAALQLDDVRRDEAQHKEAMMVPEKADK